MAGFEMNEWISCSPETVFDFMVDPANALKMTQSIKQFEKITEGPVSVGTKFRETRLINGQEATSELEVVVYEPAKQYSVMNELKGVETSYHYYFETENEGTRIKLVCEVKASGVKKMIAPVLAAIMKKEDSNHLQQLKSAIETETSQN